MSTVTRDADVFVAPAEVPEMELYHPKTWLGKYVFSQDAKVIAIQYACTAIAIGFLALVMSMLMRLQLGFPGTFSFINPSVHPVLPPGSYTEAELDALITYIRDGLGEDAE